MVAGEIGMHGAHAQLVVEEGNERGLDCAIIQNLKTVVKSVVLSWHLTQIVKIAI